MTTLKTAFEAKYPGVKINVWRSSSEDIVHRSVTEYRRQALRGRPFETDQSGLEALHREKLLQAIQSPVIADLVPQAAAPKEWLGTRLQIITAAVNTKSIPEAEWPKTYEDLLDPKWKGKIAVEAGDADWFATVVQSMGEEKGLKLFRDISEKNGFQVRKGHTLLANLIAAGEVPFAVTTYMFRVRQLNKSGAPVAPVMLQPAVARVNGIGLAANCAASERLGAVHGLAAERWSANPREQRVFLDEHEIRIDAPRPRDQVCRRRRAAGPCREVGKALQRNHAEEASLIESP